MKKILLSTMLTVCAVLLSNVSAQELTLKIIETHKDGEISVSYDDGEYENDSIDKLDDDDLDMGWEGDDLNIMTSFTRFQNVTIPQGETINSAILTVYAHEDESDEAIITVYGEAIDDSPAFEEDEALADRTYTTASVDWTCSENWTMWEPYDSPDLAAIIQEIVNRPEWQSGNSLTLFMQGVDQGANLLDNARDFESFENIEDPEDGGDGLHHPERVPTLVINYGSEGTSALNSASISKAISIYPNPVSTDIVNVKIAEEVAATISVLDLSGKIMSITNTVVSDNRINLTELNQGIYLVQVETATSTYTEKIIID